MHYELRLVTCHFPRLKQFEVTLNSHWLFEIFSLDLIAILVTLGTVR